MTNFPIKGSLSKWRIIKDTVEIYSLNNPAIWKHSLSSLEDYNAIFFTDIQKISRPGYPDSYDAKKNMANYASRNIFIRDFNGDGVDDILEVITVNKPAGEILYCKEKYEDPIHVWGGASYVLCNSFFDYNQLMQLKSERDIPPNTYNRLTTEDRRTVFKLRASDGNTYSMTIYTDVSIQTLGDFNGDGILDILTSSDGIYTLFNASSQKLVTKLTDNASGKNTNIQYQVSSNSTIHKRGSFVSDSTISIAGKLPLVKSVEIADGSGGKNIRQFTYEDLTFNKNSFGILGFKRTQVKDVTNELLTSNVFEEMPFVKAWLPVENTISTMAGEPLVKTIKKYEFQGTVNPSQGTGYNYLKKETVSNYLKGTSSSSEYQHDDHGNIVSVKTKDNEGNLMQRKTTYANVAFHRPNKPVSLTETVTNKNGSYFRKTNMSYTTQGDLASVVNDPDTDQALTTSYQYNNYGLPTKITLSAPGEKERMRTFEYDPLNRFIVATQNKLGQTIRKEYEPYFGQVVSETNEVTGLKQSFRYNNAGQLTESTSPEGVTTKISIKNSNSLGKYYILTEAPGRPYQKIHYDSEGRIIAAETQGFNTKLTTRKAYNAKGQLVSESDPYRNGESPVYTTYEYDRFGRIQSIAYKDLTTSYSYDLLKVATRDSEGQTMIKETDAVGNVKYVIDVDGNRVDYSYHPSGSLKKVASSGRTLIEMEYDNYGRQTSLTDQNAGTTKYRYDAFGQLRRQEDANGNIIELSYDQYGRITGKETPGGTYRYNYYSGNNASNGLLHTVSGPADMGQSYEYNRLGYLTAFTDIIQGERLQTKYGYDDYGNVNLTSYPSGFIVENKYNKAGYLYEVKDTKGTSIWKLEDTNSFGSITRERDGNGLYKEYGYDSYHNLTHIKAGSIQNLAYTIHSPVRQLISSRTDNLANQHEAFQYDNLHRLTYSQVGATSLPVTIAYQRNGNIDYKSDAGTYIYHPDKIHAVTKVATVDNVMPLTSQQISYNAFNKVSSVSEGSYRYSFLYGVDAERSRMFEYTNNTLTLEKTYTTNYEREVRGNQTIENHYIQTPSGTTAIFRKENGNLGDYYYLCKDHLGSITALVDQSGNVRERFAYDAWGRRVNPNDWTDYDIAPSTFLSRGYTGHEHLDKVGLINMNGRMYDPFLGRMLSPDNLVPDPMSLQGYNKYSYCYNNPMHYVDPDGENPWAVFAYLAFSYLRSAYNGGDRSPYNYNGQERRNYDAGSWAWNPKDWFSEGQPDVVFGLSSTYTGIAGSLSIGDYPNFAIGYSSEKGIGVGYMQNGSTYMYYPSYNYNAPEQSVKRTLQEMAESIYNSNFTRSVFPDFISVDVGFSGIASIGTEQNVGLTWVTRGSQASFYPMLTTSPMIAKGYQIDATISFEGTNYIGSVSNIRREMVKTNSALGDIPSFNISGGPSCLGKLGINMGGTYNMKSNQFLLHRGWSFGLGLPAGPFPFNGSIGARNTIILRDFN